MCKCPDLGHRLHGLVRGSTTWHPGVLDQVDPSQHIPGTRKAGDGRRMDAKARLVSGTICYVQASIKAYTVYSGRCTSYIILVSSHTTKTACTFPPCKLSRPPSSKNWCSRACTTVHFVVQGVHPAYQTAVHIEVHI